MVRVMRRYGGVWRCEGCTVLVRSRLRMKKETAWRWSLYAMVRIDVVADFDCGNNYQISCVVYYAMRLLFFSYTCARFLRFALSFTGSAKYPFACLGFRCTMQDIPISRRPSLTLPRPALSLTTIPNLFTRWIIVRRTAVSVNLSVTSEPDR